ncbi:MAG: hypothetical protein ACR2LX_02895 [Jatrophihabitans sp.]
MTSALTFAHVVDRVPAADSVVLAGRQLRPDTDPATLSRFRDDRWVLSPAIFEDHFRALSINFQLAPPRFRLVLKTFTWLEINHAADVSTLRHGRGTGRLAIQTIHKEARQVRALLSWLDERNIGSLSEVTSAGLDAYLDAVRSAEIRHSARDDLLQAVRRLWAFRDLLPPEGQLPEQPPWDGKDTRLLLGRSTRARENLTQRIPEAAMTALLSWALRFVEDFSDDILIALAEFRPLFDSKPGRRQRPGTRPAPATARDAGGADLAARLRALLHDLRERCEDLPGKIRPDSRREPDWAHLGRLLGCRYQSIQAPQHRRAIEQSGLAVADAAYLGTHPQAHLDGGPWMARIRFDEVDSLVRLLSLVRPA